MKELYVIRHAKSSWAEKNSSDFDRGLNQRGKRDAPYMANMMHKLNIRPELIISSPARRAYITASVFAKIFNIDDSNFITNKKIYEAGVSDLLKIINNINDKYSSIFLVGHNPGLSMLCNYLDNNFNHSLVTTGIAKIIFSIDNWKLVSKDLGNTEFYEYPKKHLK